MKLLFAGVVGVALFAAGPVLAAAAKPAAGPERCGTFNQFTTSYYCLACPGKPAAKWKACPGGNVGLIGLRSRNPGCTVGEWTAACGKKK